MRNTTYNKVVNFLKVFSGFIIAVPLLIAGTVQAVTMYSSGSLLQPNDVTSSHIRDNTIVNADISQTTAFTLSSSTIQTLHTGAVFATSSATLPAATTINNVAYTWPSADGVASSTLQTNGVGALVWGSSSQTAISNTFSAPVGTCIGEPLYIASSTPQTNNLATSTSATVNASTFTGIIPYELLQTFTAPAGGCLHIASMHLSLKKIASPTDNVQIKIQTFSGGVPSGVDLGTGLVGGASLSTTYADVNIPLTTPVTLTGGTYAVLIGRSGVNDATNKYGYQRSSSGTYTGGQEYYWNDPNWTDSSNDWLFSLGYTTTNGAVYPANATSANTSATFLGFSTATTTAGTNATITIFGTVQNVTGVVAGTAYYLDLIDGKLNQTPVGGAVKALIGTETGVGVVIR